MTDDEITICAFAAIGITIFLWLCINCYCFNRWWRCTKKGNRIRESERFVEEFFSNKRAKNRKDDR